MDRIILTDLEIDYLAYLNRKNSIYGIDSNRKKYSKNEMKEKFDHAKKNLLEKEYISLSKKNEIIISRIIYFIVIVCFEVEKFIKVEIKKDKRTAFLLYYYIYNDAIIFVEKSRTKDNEYVFNIIKDYDDLEYEILDIINLFKKSNFNEEIDNCILPKDKVMELLETKKVKKNKNPFEDDEEDFDESIPIDINRIFSKGLLSAEIYLKDFTKNRNLIRFFVQNDNYIGNFSLENDLVEIRQLSYSNLQDEMGHILDLILNKQMLGGD
jgi:hypothetical protein